MSKAISSIASVALPIVGTLIAPGIGTALGSSLSAGALGAIGGGLGGAAGGLVSGGGLKGAAVGGALGAAGGYVSGSGGFANAAQNLGLGTTGAIGPTISGAPLGAASGIAGALSSAGGAVSGALGGASSYLLPAATIAGGVLQANAGKAAANTAANAQLASTKSAIDATTIAQTKQQAIEQPFVNAGTGALKQYTDLTSSPEAQANYIQNNPMYKSLADDAQRRLLANQAAQGKVGSGGTANALQTSLLNLGNGLIGDQLSRLQNTISTGANAASGVGSGLLQTGADTANLTTQGGNASAAGAIGGTNAQNSAYQNTIGTLLALQRLKGTSNAPTYAPQPISL